MSQGIKIVLATDHAGFELKNSIKAYFERETDYLIEDCGSHHFDPQDDYPDFIAAAAERVSKAPQSTRGIIFGGSGQGEAMLANRFKNVRATTYYHHQPEIIALSRQHNDANMLAIGARFVDTHAAIEAIELWLATEPALDEKYQRRVKKAERASAGE